jgi:hypothetical protein
MTRRSFSSLAALAAGAAALCCLIACSTDDSSPGTQGALSQSTSRPSCAPEDVACQADGLDAPIAIGARVPLDVQVTARGVAAPKIALEPTRDDIIGVEKGELVAKSPGWSSVMITGDDGIILDFLTLHVARAERVELYRLTESGSVEATPMPDKIQVAVGDDFELSIKAFSGAVRLIGDLDATWTLDGNVGSLLDSGRRGSRRVRVKNPGNASLKIEAAGFTKTIAIEVLQ